MKDHLIITIGREFGSGGREIGELLAKKMGVKCYDKVLLKMAAEESGLNEKLFEINDEQNVNTIMTSLMSHSYFGSTGNFQPMLVQLFLAQFNAIKSLEYKEPCVIIGRCADDVLKNYPHKLRVFISADREKKIERVMERHECSSKEAEKMIAKTDKNRARYYNYFASGEWGDAKNYDLCLNSSVLGIEGTVEVILEYVKRLPKIKHTTEE